MNRHPKRPKSRHAWRQQARPLTVNLFCPGCGRPIQGQRSAIGDSFHSHSDSERTVHDMGACVRAAVRTAEAKDLMDQPVARFWRAHKTKILDPDPPDA